MRLELVCRSLLKQEPKAKKIGLMFFSFRENLFSKENFSKEALSNKETVFLFSYDILGVFLLKRIKRV
jgi:hypothetical protein